MLYSCFAKLYGQDLGNDMHRKHYALTAYSRNWMNSKSLSGNPAILSQLSQGGLAVNASRPYLISALNHVGITGNVKTNSGGIGLDVNYGGFQGYNELKAGFAYGRKVGENLDLGLQVNINHISISSYGATSNFSVEAGTTWHLSDQFQTGVKITNPVFSKNDLKQVVRWPTIYSVGFGYDASPGFFIGTVFEKQEDNPVNVSCGIQYKPIDQIFLRMGISSLAPSAWFGVGILYKQIEIDVTSYYHQQLGWSPGLMALFNFNQKK